MSTHGPRSARTLETRSSSFFLVAGGFFCLFAGFWGAFAFTAMNSEAVQNVVGPLGWAAAFVGLLGLYGRLAEEALRVSLVAASFAGLGFAGAVVTVLGNFALLLDVVGELPEWFAVLQLLLLLGIVLGFFSYAVATLRSDTVPRRVGILLLVPAGLFLLNIIRVATLGSTTPIWAPSVLGAGQALALLGIGYTLRVEPDPSTQPHPTSDPAGE